MSSKFATSFAALLALASVAAAQETDDAFLAKYSSTFETGGSVESTQFLPPALLSGPLHQVGVRAFNDGMHNTYFLYVGGVDTEVTTGLALRTRIRELYAIDALKRMSASEGFSKAIAEAGKQKVESVVGVVKDPLGTVAGIPKGASRFFGRVGESMKGGKSAGEDSTLKSIAGVSKAKAQLAAKLGVNPYSPNEELQRNLDRCAKAIAAGGFVVSAATAAVGGAAGDAISILGLNQTLQQTLINSTPADLRIINRKKLMDLGATRTVVDEFLLHPWFTPWHTTIIADSLAAIGVNPTVFLTDANRSLTAEDAMFFQRLAQVLATYHTSAAPISAIRLENEVITAIDKKGTVVVPLSCDYAVWAERAARRADEFATLQAKRKDIKGLALWVDGQVSPQLTKELEARKIAVKVNVLGELR